MINVFLTEVIRVLYFHESELSELPKMSLQCKIKWLKVSVQLLHISQVVINNCFLQLVCLVLNTVLSKQSSKELNSRWDIAFPQKFIN